MFCIKCGKENSDEALFCQKCGHQFEFIDEEETQVARSPNIEPVSDSDEEANIFSIHPTMMFVKIGYGLAVLASFLLVALIAAISSLLTSPISAIAVVILALLLLLIPAYFHIKQKMVRYTLTDSKVEIDQGLFNKTTRNVPLRIIQDVTVTANFSQRMLGLGNVEIENANETDDKIILKNINSPKEHAKTLLNQMRQLNK
jgi:uncharacterized membrane protein YdbT with pleckstrin-like domain